MCFFHCAFQPDIMKSVLLFVCGVILACGDSLGLPQENFGNRDTVPIEYQPIEPANLIDRPSLAPVASILPGPLRPINTDTQQCSRSGFSVRKAKRSSLKAKTQVEFVEVLTNAGGWDSKSHAFVAFCPGIYFFTFNAISANGTDFTLALMKNEKYQVTGYGGKAGYQWGSNSALLFLNPGDVVYLELQEGAVYEHPYNEAYTTFTGFLVSKI